MRKQRDASKSSGHVTSCTAPHLKPTDIRVFERANVVGAIAAHQRHVAEPLEPIDDVLLKMRTFGSRRPKTSQPFVWATCEQKRAH